MHPRRGALVQETEGNEFLLSLKSLSHNSKKVFQYLSSIPCSVKLYKVRKTNRQLVHVKRTLGVKSFRGAQSPHINTHRSKYLHPEEFSNRQVLKEDMRARQIDILKSTSDMTGTMAQWMKLSLNSWSHNVFLTKYMMITSENEPNGVMPG